MLNDHIKHEQSMFHDSAVAECSSAKRSKTSEQKQQETQLDIKDETTVNWELLPDVVISEILDKLDHQDRMNASSTCKRWRRNIYHRKWWKNVCFYIEPHSMEKTRYFSTAFSNLVSNVTIKINTMFTECVEEFVALIQIMADNQNLRSLLIEPSHCRFESSEGDMERIVKSIIKCLPRLNGFSIGCVEELSDEIECFLEVLGRKRTDKITLLGLASVKDEPGKCRNSALSPTLFKPFTGLQIFSIDYDELCDDLLNNLEGASNLHRLVVHLHSVRNHHPATSNVAWKRFKATHPLCELRLNVIHAFNDVALLHLDVLREEMPLSHLKVFFCEQVNVRVLERLSEHYRSTLRSLMWVDSLSQEESGWSLISPDHETPDPFLMIAWLCTNLEEIVMHGYKYWEENLIAIARLRGPQLKRLDIAEDDILYSNPDVSPHVKCLVDIPLNLKRPWAPLTENELHPVICNPTGGDSDEYLLPIVLADLH